MKVDVIHEGVVFDDVPGQEDAAVFAPMLKVAEDNYLTCGALVNMGLVGKKVRVTVEVFDDAPSTT